MHINILIIDDEPIIRKGLNYLLSHTEINDTHIEVVESDGSLSANQLLNQQEFDIVFTDIRMPGMDGLTFIDQWKNKLHQTQWVILSGYDDFRYAQKAISLGVKEYILKPITEKNVEDTLERLIDHYHKQSNNFISIDQLENVRITLEETIWTLDEARTISTITGWYEEIIQKKIAEDYYIRTLNDLFANLMQRVNNRGRIHVEDQAVSITGKDTSEITENFQAACIKLIEHIRLQRKGQVLDPIEFAKEFIKENLDQKLSLDDVANKIGLNAAYFSHLFKKETGISFIDFRMQLRMERAKVLIETGNMKITDIANSIGYEDLSHFTKTFKKYTGYSPSKYLSIMEIN